MDVNNVKKVYDKMLTAYEEECKTGLRSALYPDGPEPVEKQISFQPMFTDDDIENVKEHSFDDVDTCMKFIAWYSFYILSEPDYDQIIDWINSEYGVNLDEEDFRKRFQLIIDELV